MKKILLGIMLFAFATISLAANKIGTIDLGGFIQKKTIEIYSFPDPTIPGITCHLSTISVSLSFSDPSNMSIACRKTGSIILPSTMEQGVDVYKKSKSVLFKNLKVKRFYDKGTNTLIYVAHSTKVFDGSFKNSISTISLFESGN